MLSDSPAAICGNDRDPARRNDRDPARSKPDSISGLVYENEGDHPPFLEIMRPIGKILGAVALTGTCVFVVPPAVRADQSAAELASARRRFVALLDQRRSTGEPRDIPLDPRAVAAFNGRLDQYVRENGLTPPTSSRPFLMRPLPPRLAATMAYRRDFILELYRQRAARRPDGTAGGVSFGLSESTPIRAVNPVNLFNFFPSFRVGRSSGQATSPPGPRVAPFDLFSIFRANRLSRRASSAREPAAVSPPRRAAGRLASPRRADRTSAR